MDKTRRLTQALLISGTFNILLLAGIFYWIVREVSPRPYCELKPAEQQEEQLPLAINHANADVLRSFRLLPLEQLVAKLSDTQLVENGYTQRDLSLAALVSFHHFDISRALLGEAQPKQQRMMPYAKNREGGVLDVVVYPGLTEQQFQTIIKYAQTERWPLTSQGMFQLLRKQHGQYDPNLADAFFLTPEFLAVEMLFNRSEKNVEKKDLLTVLCQGDWKLFSSFVEQQRLVQDLSPARRQKFLIDFIESESRAAAYLMLKTDGAFALRKLDDEHVNIMLKLLVEKTPEAEQFTLALLTSPRSDSVLQNAGIKLFEYSGEPVPNKDITQAALARFVQPKPVSKVKPSTTIATPKKKSSVTLSKKEKKTIASVKQMSKPSARRPRMYVVTEGDSLWKIAKRFDIEIEVLRKSNRLKNDSLKPGTALFIP